MEEHAASSGGTTDGHGPGSSFKVTGRRYGVATPPPLRRSSVVHVSRDATKKEIQPDDEATLRELLIRYQHYY